MFLFCELNKDGEQEESGTGGRISSRDSGTPSSALGEAIQSESQRNKPAARPGPDSCVLLSSATISMRMYNADDCRRVARQPSLLFLARLRMIDIVEYEMAGAGCHQHNKKEERERGRVRQWEPNINQFATLRLIKPNQPCGRRYSLSASCPVVNMD